MPDKQPRFFCEFCGTEVKRNDKVCPNCGRFFSAVRCPACGLTGQAALFIKGCPACGYAVLPGSVPANSPAKKKKQRKAPRRAATARRNAEAGGEPLPLWVYIAVTALAALVVAALVVHASG